MCGTSTGGVAFVPDMLTPGSGRVPGEARKLELEGRGRMTEHNNLNAPTAKMAKPLGSEHSDRMNALGLVEGEDE